VHGSLVDAGHKLEIAHGVIVDVGARRVLRDLVGEHEYVQDEAMDGDVAYVQIHHYDASTDEVRAYRVSTGELSWSVPSTCWSMVAAPAGLFCSDAMGRVAVMRRSDGRASVVGRLGWSMAMLVRSGDRVVGIGGDVPRAAIFDARSGGHVADLDLPARMRVAIADAGRVCGVTGSEVLCFDGVPQILWTRTLPSPIAIRTADAHDVLVEAGGESIALALVDGRKDAAVQGAMASFVRSESGRLVGFVRAPPATAFVDLDGHERWAIDAFPYASTATALLAGDLVVVAAWNVSSAGASLEAFDHATGTRRWVASVQTLPITHSAYSNDVELRFELGALVLRGRESMQDYLELFEPHTGTRVLSVLGYR
jgi:hypothetical protein